MPKVEIMSLIKVKNNFQITIPHILRKKLNLAVGDYMEIENQDGDIIFKPVKVIHPDTEYFYTKEWQKGEAQADADIVKGDVIGPFDNIKDSVKALKKAKV